MAQTHLRHFFLIAFCFSIQQLYAGIVPSQAHRARENEYDVNFYFLDLDIEYDSSAIEGNALIRAKALTAMDTFAIELDTTFTIDSIITDINGGTSFKTRYTRDSSELNLLMPLTVRPGAYVEARIYYHGIPIPQGPITGVFHNAISRFSLSEPYAAYTWYPCKQELTDKADSSWFFITTDTSSRGISNGLLTAVTQVSPTKKRWEWKSHHAIDYYLISFAVGKYDLTTSWFHPTGRTDSMQLQYYDFGLSIDTMVKSALQIYSDLFGLYPFYDEKLGYVNIPGQYGAMENQTIISGYGATVHEMAHQWFGDNVTCASFKDVMLNEGFAAWCESIYAEFCGGGDSARIRYFNRIENSDVNSWGNSSGYYPPDTSTEYGTFIEYLYYDKNAMMINSLRFVVNNDSLFFLGLRNYQTRFHASTAYGTDLREVMENTTGMDLSTFFNQWYYGRGYPVFTYTWNQVDNQLMLKIKERATSDSTPLFKTPLEFLIITSTGDSLVKTFIDDTISTYRIPITGTFHAISFDPHQWIPNGRGQFPIKDTSLIVSDIYTIRNQPNFIIYPNPTANTATITIDQSLPGATLTLSDITGRILSTTQLQTPTSQLQTGNLASGVYLLQLTANGQRAVKELVKQ